MSYPLGNRNIYNRKVSFLVLDFNKPDETHLCLSSIRSKAKIENYEIVLLSNGGKQDYVLEFYKSNLIDRLVLSKKNHGCGAGTNALFNLCDTEYCFYVQNDQYLTRDLSEKELDALIHQIETKGYQSVDVSGGAGHVGKYSERAHFIKAKTINDNPRKGFGGPGPFEKNMFWSEEAAQIYFKENDFKIFNGWPLLFANNGKFTVRETEDGEVFRQNLSTGEKEIIQ